MARWPKNPTEMAYILQHLTTSYNILQHLKSNLEVTISSEMHLESQLNFWGAGPPGPVV